MAAWDAADLDTFFDADMPGTVSVVLTPGVGGPDVSFTGRMVRGGAAGFGLIAEHEWALQFRVADAPEAASGDGVAIGLATFKLRERSKELCSRDGAVVGYLMREVVE